MKPSLLPVNDMSDANTSCCCLKRLVPYAVVLCLASLATAAMAVRLMADDSGTAKAKGEQTPAETDETPAQEYIRIRRNERKLSVALETSVIRFADSKKYPDASVDLIGAIHLGDPEYYKQLNELFKKYDVLLFEAVMPEEAVRRDLRPGGGEGSRRRNLEEEQEWTEAKVGLAAIGVLQLGMKGALGMEF